MNTKAIAKVYRLAHWAEIMRERQDSGLSIRAYCKKAGFHENIYFYWQRKLREAACQELNKQQDETNRSNKSLIPSGVTVPVPSGWAICEATETNVAENTLIIEIGGCKIIVDGDVNHELLAKVCKVLVSLC